MRKSNFKPELNCRLISILLQFDFNRLPQYICHRFKRNCHCKKEGIEIVAVYKEDHSAKNFNRPQFKRTLQYLTKNKGKIELLLVTSWDRFSGNQSESFGMIKRLHGYGCEIQAIEQPLDLTIPENLMLLSFYLAMPDIDNKRRSIKITEGIRAGKKQGRWLTKAPFGYTNGRDQSNKPVILEGPHAKIVKEIFDKLSKGHPQSEVREILKRRKIHISKTNMSQIARNQAYIGNVFVKTGTTSKEGYYIKGIHKPIITEELFFKVQEKLSFNLKQKKKAYGKCLTDKYPLRGFIKCNQCENVLTASSSKSRSGDYHDYYHCNSCKKVRIPASQVYTTVENILDEIKISKPAKSLYNLMVKKILSKENAPRKKSNDTIVKEITINQERIKRLQDGFADGIIDAKTFQETSNRYKQQIQLLEKEKSEEVSNESTYEQYLKNGIDLLSDVKTFYAKGDYSVKHTILGSIFPEKLFFDKIIVEPPA